MYQHAGQCRQVFSSLVQHFVRSITRYYAALLVKTRISLGGVFEFRRCSCSAAARRSCVDFEGDSPSSFRRSSNSFWSSDREPLLFLRICL